MAEPQPLELSPAQIKVLEKLVQAGFQFASMEHITRHVMVEKSGFVALLDPAEGSLKLFSQVGYRVGEGIGMLVQENNQPAFVWKKQSVSATADLLAAYESVKEELVQILNERSIARNS